MSIISATPYTLLLSTYSNRLFTVMNKNKNTFKIQLQSRTPRYLFFEVPDMTGLKTTAIFHNGPNWSTWETPNAMKGVICGTSSYILVSPNSPPFCNRKRGVVEFLSTLVGYEIFSETLVTISWQEVYFALTSKSEEQLLQQLFELYIFFLSNPINILASF